MLLNAFRKLFSNSQNRKARRASSRPELLQLEGRIVPATITVTTTSDAVGHSGISLRDAITTANTTAGNDDIVFNTGVTGTIALAAALPTIITSATAGALTITGPGASSLTISGSAGGFSIFTINTGGDLSISGVTVSGANTSGNGGAFNNSGTLTLTNSTLSGNTATKGGGIYNSGILTVTNSTLSGNSAGVYGRGGGIANSGTLTVTNSTLSGNTANNGFAGGIFNNGNLTLTNSALSGNSAGYSGGGITNNGILTVTNSTLSGNTAYTFGGGIYNFGTITVTNSTLSGNTAKFGGGIFNYATVTATVTNSTLSGNTAKYGGGINNRGTITVTNSTLSGNSATTNGGGIYNRVSSYINVTNSTLSGNTAFNGGGIFNAGTLNIANTIIANSTSGGDFVGTAPNTNTNNLVETLGTVIGTFTPAYSADPILGPLQNNGGPTFTMALGANSPAISAGAIPTITPAVQNVASVPTYVGFFNNGFSGSAPLGGVQVGWYANGNGVTDALVTAVSTGNQTITIAPGNGMFQPNANYRFSSYPLLDQRGINRTTSDIGAYSFGIQVTNTSDVNTVGSGSLRAAINLANTTAGNDQISFNLTGSSPYTITLAGELPNIIDANTVVGAGTAGTVTINGLGASSLIIDATQGFFKIFAIVSGGNLSISGVTVTGANAGGFGGAFTNSGILNISNSTISGNLTVVGGGIFNNTGASLTLTNSTLSGNTGTSGGGGIVNKGTVTVSNSTIFGNYNGSGGGGGILNYGTGTLNISNSTISGNTVQGSAGGGGISNFGTLTLTNSTLSGNITYGGGGGGIRNSGSLTLTNSTLSNNFAPTGGGIFNNPSSTVSLTDSTISGNSATYGSGGGMDNRGTLTVTNSTISGNTAAAGGGISNNGGGTLTVTNSTISGNTATTTFGGGIYNFSTATVTVSNSTISGNTASYGGGISTLRGTVTVTNSTISGNSASSDGGGISTLVGTLTVSNSTLSGNTATTNGGAIFNNSGTTLTVTNSTISGNSSINGGGIYNRSYSPPPFPGFPGSPAGILNIANTIIANSTTGGDYAGGGTVNLISGATAANNFITQLAPIPGIGAWATTVTSVQLNLGTLANNGGPTQTLALLTGSVAIGAANATISNAAPVNGLDQRGVTRSSTAPSIGAYEAAATVAPGAPTNVTGTAGNASVSIAFTAPTNNGGSAITDYKYSLDGGTTLVSAGTTTSPFTITGLTNGTQYSITLYAVNSVGNSVASSPASVTPLAPPTSTAPLITGTPTPPSSSASSTVNLYNAATGEPTGTAVPFPGFNGPVKVVSGDFNGDGVAELIAGAGFGGGPAIAILNSQTGEVMESFFAFDPAFTGGVFVAVQDTNGDGILDIIAAAGPGGGPEVRIFDGSNLNVLRAFFAYDQSFTGGVSVASIDFNNDGILDLVTGAGPGGAPHVKVFDGATNAIISQWYAYPVTFTGGVFVAVGDIGNNGTFEVVTGAGPSGAPVVAVWDPFTGALLSQFMAYTQDFTGGVRVAVNDGNGDGIADIITGAGPGGGPHVKAFSFPALDLLFSFYSGEQTNPGGVFVS